MSQQSVSLFDARPFFEKALAYGVQHGIIDQTKLDAICQDAPKGMVQIARYFGTEFLRPELEKARDRMVNLVSLYLEHSSGGDLRRAAESLRDNSFLSRSKGGSDMLKALIAMPQNSHFGMNEGTGFTDDHIPLLAKWSLRTLPEYQAELALRQQATLLVNAATRMAETLGLNAEELEEAGKDAEAVIRTALLARLSRRTEMPDWVAFEKLILALRKKYPSADSVPAITLPKDLPPRFVPVVERVQQSVLVDMPKILDAKLPARKLFDQTPAFMGRYFWLEDAVSEVDHFDRNASAAWNKATGGHGDDGSLLTLFLCVAAGSPPKTVLTEKSAATLVRKIRKSGLKLDLASQYIADNAPQHSQSDYIQLWEAFVEDAESTLVSDRDYALNDALSLLRRECNIAA
ncbi:hypothetical protein HZ993_03345 [Rhodoferax sp. AJA081-3]|uniref:hypothetical protein n=1 Tax=Rhodoferax sp. AJA081-3 TaxID=2752316 RepID=UPI001ADFC48E|nr:hypothetical protein [Rhodoferax sp. AJA081-3]QTN28892.1 hypothetical protein HZ993_03345 [Rhodoferax sp. AJA081-3]